MLIPPLEVPVEQSLAAAESVEVAAAMPTPAATEPPPPPIETIPAVIPATPAQEPPTLAISPPPAEAEAAPGGSTYQPPFPDRTDLFMPPKRERGANSGGSAENTVQLLGFVRVDRQKAVLSINGEISSLAVGDSYAGIEVISINRPTVVLQRGRQRWQATLE